MRLTLGQQHRLQRLDVIGKWCLARTRCRRRTAVAGRIDRLHLVLDADAVDETTSRLVELRA